MLGSIMKTEIRSTMTHSWTWKKIKYSQTCIKRSPLGQRKIGLLRQVLS